MKNTILPKYRKGLYAIWRACERLRILPPNVKQDWNGNDILTQAYILAYERIRDYEDSENLNAMAKLVTMR